MTYLLIAEKPSAAKNFADALGGMSGKFEGQDYKIQSLFGHMVEYVEPHLMVPDTVLDEFKSWDPQYLPWDVSQLTWNKKPQKTKNPRTGKMSSKADGIANVKKAAQGCTALVIATDKDPSGEGQLIGWEVIHAIGWTGPVKRMYFIDESKKGLKQGFRDIEDLPTADKDGEYVKADVRSRWDFLSMQLTRLSTHAARSNGYSVVIRQGRLKSVMTKLVADQLALIKAYKKKPYFEVKYKDDKANTYTRKYEDGDAWRFDVKADAESDAKSYGTSNIIQDSKSRKQSAPGKLLDLGGLASILGTKGFKSKEVLSTYQKMYEAKIVSYPRTEDKIISSEQFKEMLPLVDKIAGVVGADISLLTHRSPRKTHVKDGGAHGANRPGLVVPTSLDSLSKYGTSAKAIYDLLAKNFLAMFGENYEYDSIKAHVEDHPAFKTTLSIPVNLGFKAIFDADKESKDEDDDDDNKDSKGIGATGNPVVTEGVNKKPPHPTHKWLERQLSKYDVGTGATRVNTLSEVTAGKTALLTDTRGKLNLTKIGEIAAVLLDGSHIGDPGVTEKLFKAMRDAGDFKISVDEVMKTATDLVRHDKEVFYKNGAKLKAIIGEPDSSMKQAPMKPKATGIFAPTGESVTFNKVWGGYDFTDTDVENLLAGKEITIKRKGKSPGTFINTDGKLGEGEYKGKKFWGFQLKKVDEYTVSTANFPAEWSGYKFTKEDEAKLRAGEKINIKAKSARTGNDFEVDVSFGIDEYKGFKNWKIIPHFEDTKKVDPSKYTRADAPFNTTIAGYKLTDAEVKSVRAGDKVTITGISKKKKPFTCNVSLEIKEYKGNKSWGLEMHFN